MEFRPKASFFLVPSGRDMVMVDSQLVAISAVRLDSVSGWGGLRSLEKQRSLLAVFVKKEEAFIVTDMGMQIINPQSQWVMSNGRGWMIWYFRVGKVPAELKQPAVIQLFASTVIGESVLTLNAPVFSISNFSRIALTVNDMMENLHSVQRE